VLLFIFCGGMVLNGHVLRRLVVGEQYPIEKNNTGVR
jgi:hypothetical protein